MSGGASPALAAPSGWARFALEAVFRALAAAGLSAFVIQAYAQYRATGDLPVLLILLAETLTVLLVIFARAPRLRSLEPVAVLLTVGATYYFLFISLAPGAALAPKWIGEALQVAGIAIQISAKLALGRSFGLLPANRGVVSKGPYRIVRHPIYLGYFVAHMGFLLYAFTPANVLLFAGLYALQIGRMLEEERLLRSDRAYARYASTVRWRFLPGVF